MLLVFSTHVIFQGNLVRFLKLIDYSITDKTLSEDTSGRPCMVFYKWLVTLSNFLTTVYAQSV